MTTAANPVNWFEIYVADLKRAKAFYEAMLGIKLEKLDTPAPGIDEMWMFPAKRDGAGAAGALVRMQGGPSGGNNSVIVYFSTDDCGVVAKKVPGAGGKIMKQKFSIGQYGYIALVEDTERNVVGLHSMQ
jgi:predicted enzyme related to lactoylglutathione lyase